MHSSLALATILVLFSASAFAAQLSIFVATDGSNYGDGSIGRPLKTWYDAAGYIMDLQNKSAYTDIFVEFRGGKYYFDNTIYFTASASGSPSLRIHYRGYQNEVVEFIGGQSLGGWSKAISPAVWSRLKHHARSHIIVAPVNPSLVGTLQPRGMSAWGQGPPMELFFQGKAMQLARYPNEDFMTLNTVNLTDKGFTFKDSSNIANWQQETDPWAHGYWGNDWADDYVPIKPLTVANGVVSSGALSDLSMGIQAGQRFYLYNFLSELDSPGEYYIDRTNNLIYFWPPSEDYTTADFVVSTLDSNFLNMDDVAYVSFSNFTIEAARYTGIYGHNMHHVNFTRLTIRNVGTEAMVVDGPSNIVIEDCHIYGTGTYGIILEGGYRNNLTKSNHVIRNNKIHDWTRVVRTYRPAISIDGVGITVEYNELFDAPHNALMWKGNYHTIQHNVVHDVCYETGDVGAFYSGRDWTRRGNVIRHNLFYNIDGPGFLGASAIYLDDQYSSVEIYDNIFYNIFQVLVLGGGRDNNFTNNLIINSKNGIYMDARGLGQCGPQSDWELRDNLAKVPYTQPPWSTAFPKLATILNGNPHEPTGNTMGYNLFVNLSGAWKNFCPDAQVTPYVDMKENCFALAMSDFSNPIHLNFTIINNALSKCTATFTSKYHTIASSGFGIHGTFAI